MSKTEFNKAFRMIHSVYRLGKSELDDAGVEKVRLATRGLIATNLPGEYSAAYTGKSGADKTVATIKFIHGKSDQECLVLKDSLVRKTDGIRLGWSGRQTVLTAMYGSGQLSDHTDGHHYVLKSDKSVRSSHRAIQFSHGTEVDSVAEIRWFSRQFSWSSKGGKSPNQTTCIEDWLGDDESMKNGITLENYKKIFDNGMKVKEIKDKATTAGLDLTVDEQDEIDKLSKEIKKLKGEPA